MPSLLIRFILQKHYMHSFSWICLTLSTETLFSHTLSLFLCEIWHVTVISWRINDDVMVTTISDKIVDTFTFLTPYFVTVIPFSPPSLSVQCPLSPNNVVPQFPWSCGTNKQHWIGDRGLFHKLLRDKKSDVIWCTKSAMERQYVN